MDLREALRIGHHVNLFQEPARQIRQLSCLIPVVALPSFTCHVTTPCPAFRRQFLLPTTRPPRPDWREAEGQRRAWGEA